MEEMYAGDPAVLSINIVSSMAHATVTPPFDISQPTEEETSNEQPSTSTPCVGCKRRRWRIDLMNLPSGFNVVGRCSKKCIKKEWFWKADV